MSGIFVNYRHGGHAVAVASVAKELGAHFGPGQVFFDELMESGSRYPDELRDRLAAADVLVVVIHDGWVRTFGREHDWVRWEIAQALAAGKEIVPVLLDGVAPPTRAELPDDIAELALRQATRLRAAHLADDVARLTTRLERWIAPDLPVRPRPEPRRRRPLLRAAPALFGVLLLPFLLVLAVDGDAQDFVVMAAVSAYFLVGGAIVFAIKSLAIKWLHRLGRHTGGLPYGEYLRKSWIVMGLLGVVVATGMIEFFRQDGSRRIPAGLTLLVCGAYYLHQVVHRTSRHEKEWPPEPTLEPPRLRRTAVRLRDRLTSRPGSPAPRSRLEQAQAVEVYLDLAEARLALTARRDCSWRSWLAGRYTVTPMVFMAWPVGIAALLAQVAATVENPRYPLVAILVVGAAAVGALAIVLHRQLERRHDRWVVAELTEWLNTLGPLVFVRDHRSSSGARIADTRSRATATGP